MCFPCLGNTSFMKDVLRSAEQVCHSQRRQTTVVMRPRSCWLQVSRPSQLFMEQSSVSVARSNAKNPVINNWASSGQTVHGGTTLMCLYLIV